MPTLEPIRCGGCGANVEIDLTGALPACKYCGATLAPAQVTHGYDVVFQSYDRARLAQVIAALSGTLGYGMSLARDFLTGAPRMIRCGAASSDAARIRDVLAAAGAQTTIVPCPGHHED